MGSALKGAGLIAAFAAGIVLLLAFGGLMLFGVAWASVHLTDYAVLLSLFVLVVCIFVVLPLALFRKTRTVAAYGFMIASYIFGASTWLAGLLMTIIYLGGWGVIIGLVLGMVGVVPLGIIGCLWHSDWSNTISLIIGLVLTFGARGLAMWLATVADRTAYEAI